MNEKNEAEIKMQIKELMKKIEVTIKWN